MVGVKKTGIKKPNVDLESKVNELKGFLQQCKRVLMVSRKPTREEFLTVSKITGLGICVLGALGFIIHVPITYIKGLIRP